jgi:hypothetical protein
MRHVHPQLLQYTQTVTVDTLNDMLRHLCTGLRNVHRVVVYASVPRGNSERSGIEMGGSVDSNASAYERTSERSWIVRRTQGACVRR